MERFLLGINLLALVIFIIALPVLPPEVPLFYSYPTAEEQLVPLVFIFLPLLAADFFVVLNKALVVFLFGEKESFEKLLTYTSYFFVLSAFYMFIKTIILVV